MAFFTLHDTSIAAVKLISKEIKGDNRGHLSRLFCGDELHALGLDMAIKQINHSKTVKTGTVRGIHLQRSPFAETKIVSCLKGAIFDVAVDLRPDSETFLKWEGRTLSEDNWQSLYIPKGFGHGFQALTDNVEMIYFHDTPYSIDHEIGVNCLDETLNIEWPLEISTISDKDSQLGGVENIMSI